MFRKRLKSKQGCLRCKARHRKCDETHPTCCYCRHQHLLCVWPTHCFPVPADRVNQATPRDQPNMLCRGPRTTMPSFDPFCITPLPQSDQGEVVSCLQQFFILIARHNLPFENVGAPNELAHGWFESAMLERATCYAMLSYWAKIQSRIAGHAGLHELSCKLEMRTLSFLRRQVESRSAVTENILMTAAIHYASAAIDIVDSNQLRKILYGIRTLVDRCGGFNQIVARMKPSTLFSVQYTDIFNSLANADNLLFVTLRKPHRPPSFVSVFSPRDSRKAVGLAVRDSEILDTVGLVEFLLFFRHPSRQTRSLSHEEFHHLCSLEYWLSYRLGSLQYKHVDTGSPEEVLVVSMVVVKLEVISEGSQHPIMVLAILKRLQTAISSHDLNRQLNSHIALDPGLLTVWACFTALVGQHFETEREWFSEYVRKVLIRRYGESPGNWPSLMEDKLRDELQQFPWHPRLDLSFVSVCAELRRT